MLQVLKDVQGAQDHASWSKGAPPALLGAASRTLQVDPLVRCEMFTACPGSARAELNASAPGDPQAIAVHGVQLVWGSCMRSAPARPTQMRSRTLARHPTTICTPWPTARRTVHSLAARCARVGRTGPSCTRSHQGATARLAGRRAQAARGRHARPRQRVRGGQAARGRGHPRVAGGEHGGPVQRGERALHDPHRVLHRRDLQDHVRRAQGAREAGTAA